MAAESGTGHLQVGALIKLHVIHIHGGGGLQEGLVLLHIHIQVGAVGGQAGVQSRRAAGAQVTADIGGADEHDLGLLFHYHIADDLGIGIGGVVLQQGVLTYDDTVGAVAAQLFGQPLYLIAQQQAAQLHAQVIGQLAAFADELEIGGHQLALALLAEYPYALEGGGIGIHKSRHSHFLLSIR